MQFIKILILWLVSILNNKKMAPDLKVNHSLKFKIWKWKMKRNLKDK